MASPKSPVAIIVFFIIILTILTSTNIAIGAAQVSRTVSSSGVISPNPSPNLAAIPSFWSASPLSTAWVINSGDQATRQSIVYPYTKNGQTTIELLPNPTFIPLATSCGGIYELDGQKTPIKTGDHVVYRVWLMTGPATTTENPNTGYWGTNIGIDLWTSNTNGRICEIRTPNGVTTYPSYPSLSATNVPFGTTTLTEITIDFIVQAQYIADPWGGYAAGTMVTPTYIIPWFCAMSANPAAETAPTWIFNTELYINP